MSVEHLRLLFRSLPADGELFGSCNSYHYIRILARFAFQLSRFWGIGDLVLVLLS